MCLDWLTCSAFSFYIRKLKKIKKKKASCEFRNPCCIYVGGQSCVLCISHLPSPPVLIDFLRFIFFLVKVLQNTKLLFAASLIAFNAGCRTLGFSLPDQFSFISCSSVFTMHFPVSEKQLSLKSYWAHKSDFSRVYFLFIFLFAVLLCHMETSSLSS